MPSEDCVAHPGSDLTGKKISILVFYANYLSHCLFIEIIARPSFSTMKRKKKFYEG